MVPSMGHHFTRHLAISNMTFLMVSPATIKTAFSALGPGTLVNKSLQEQQP
jgi:hypothetical protein